MRIAAQMAAESLKYLILPTFENTDNIFGVFEIGNTSSLASDVVTQIVQTTTTQFGGFARSGAALEQGLGRPTKLGASFVAQTANWCCNRSFPNPESPYATHEPDTNRVVKSVRLPRLQRQLRGFLQTSQSSGTFLYAITWCTVNRSRADISGAIAWDPFTDLSLTCSHRHDIPQAHHPLQPGVLSS